LQFRLADVGRAAAAVVEGPRVRDGPDTADVERVSPGAERLPDGVKKLPDGTDRLPDGTERLPDGT
jgi:hypothetical protein